MSQEIFKHKVWGKQNLIIHPTSEKFKVTFSIGFFVGHSANYYKAVLFIFILFIIIKMFKLNLSLINLFTEGRV